MEIKENESNIKINKSEMEILRSKKIFALAPMVQNSSKPYRILARLLGANLVFTEMINVESYLRKQNIKKMDDFFKLDDHLVELFRKKMNPFNPKNINILDENVKNIYDDHNYDLIIQVCGHNPETIIKCCEKIYNSLEGKIFGFDLNLGCPQKIAKRGNYGAFLSKDIDLVEKILKEMVQKLKCRVSAKIRIFEDEEKTIEYVKRLEKTGISLLTVHGRTISQKGPNTGLADWGIIRKIKNTLKIPVIGNGNIAYQRDIKNFFDFTESDGLMIAETHLYNPYIFHSYVKFLDFKLNEQDLKLIKTCIAKISENESVFEVCKLYLTLSKIFEDNLGEVKSHLFKILHTFFDKNKNFLDEISDIRKIKDFQKFIDFNKELLKEIQCSPKLRSPYVSSNKFNKI